MFHLKYNLKEESVGIFGGFYIKIWLETAFLLKKETPEIGCFHFLTKEIKNYVKYACCLMRLILNGNSSNLCHLNNRRFGYLFAFIIN